MIRILLVFSLFIRFGHIWSQEQESTVFKSDTMRSEHMIDLAYGFEGWIGYNYFLRVNKKLSFGSRLGLGYYGKPNDLVPQKNRYVTSYDFLSKYLIWRSVFAEAGAGYMLNILVPIDNDLKPSYDGFPLLRIGVHTILFDKILIRTGCASIYNRKSGSWYFSPSLSLGYKF